MELNKMLLNNECVINEIKEKIKRYLETNENENTTIQNLWDSGKQSKREIHSITGLSQNTRKISNKQFNFTLKELEKEQQTKSNVSIGRKYVRSEQK